jgi:hypothetical protein
LIEINNGAVGEPQEIGQGSLAEVYRDHDSQVHLAWCTTDSLVNYSGPYGTSGQIDFPPCRSRPGILQDNQERLHLTWFSDQVEQSGNNCGQI